MSQPINPLDFTNEDAYWEAVHEQAMGPSTLADLDRADANARGAARPDRQWVLSDRDVWYRNPFYVGPDQAHPEDEYGVDETQEAYEARLAAKAARAAAPVAPVDAQDDIPF
jgi:hypothetical protein